MGFEWDLSEDEVNAMGINCKTVLPSALNTVFNKNKVNIIMQNKDRKRGNEGIRVGLE